MAFAALSRLESHRLPEGLRAPEGVESVSTVLAFLGQSAATGKTTCAVNVAAALARGGARTLVIDLDRGGFASEWLLPRGRGAVNSVAGVLFDDIEIANAVCRTETDSLEIIPAAPDLGRAAEVWAGDDRGHQRLRRALAPLREQFAHIVIDCPPELSSLTAAALVAADGFIVPAVPGRIASDRFVREMEAVARLWERCEPHGTLLGIVANQLTAEEMQRDERVVALLRRFEQRLFDTRIPTDAALSKAHQLGLTIFQFEASLPIAERFRQLADEICARCEAGFRENDGAPDQTDEPEREPIGRVVPPEQESREYKEKLEELDEELSDVELTITDAEHVDEFSEKLKRGLPQEPPIGPKGKHGMTRDEEKETFRLAAESLGMEYIDLDDLQVTKELLAAIPADLAQELGVFPVAVTAVGLRVALANPFGPSVEERLREVTDQRVFVCVSSEKEVRRLIRRHYG